MKKRTSNKLVDPKIAKLKEELENNNAKIRDLHDRNVAITEELHEREKTSIVGIVNNINMSPEQLAQFFVQIGKLSDGADAEEEKSNPEDGVSPVSSESTEGSADEKE